MGLPARLARVVLSSRSLDRDRTLAAVERLGALTHLVASLELLARRADRGRGGPNDWAVARRRLDDRGPVARRVLNATAQPGAATVLHVARAASAAFLLAPTGRFHRSRAVANATIAASSVGAFPGHVYGTDGSDQASFLVQATAALARSSRQPRVTDAALWFLGLQSTLNYTASGWVKMVSPTWRSGRALPGVMRTVTYGHQGAWRATERFPRSSTVVGHAVLALECLFPIVFAGRGRLAPLLVGSAAAFHAANAGLMGLGRFVGAFCAMQPAVLYVTDPRRKQDRSDAVPVAAAVVAAAAFAGGMAVTARRRRAVAKPRPDVRLMATGAGNELAYTVRNEHATGPVVFFESTLSATEFHWEWVRRPLSEKLTTVVYQRAGYGASVLRDREPFTVDKIARDFADLAAELAGDRPVVVVGHSLGGYLALRAAEALGDRIQGVVLVDPNHPGGAARSARQADSARDFENVLRYVLPSMRLGLGSLLQIPQSFDRLPAELRASATEQYRDMAMWSAVYREWNAVKDDSTGRLPKTSAELLVLSASATVEADEVQQELHRELGGTGDGARFHVIGGSDHETIITDRVRAEVVAEHIAAFVSGLTEPRR
ncbi:alpha/beta fold hydrolase [Actinoplanes sp. M2I2]|uniref:alpha/beta fold hydrolase n=1 Tax=Actinoplanes sp. M2I2 TaxID=1734444 RepID=UPI002021D8EC|nr:alpha/beta fold hydrolase [Actinoplanes sp. M2I2]